MLRFLIVASWVSAESSPSPHPACVARCNKELLASCAVCERAGETRLIPLLAPMDPGGAANAQPRKLTRTRSAPLLGRKPYPNIPLAGAIAGPDTYGGFRREFFERRQRERQQERQQVAAAAAAGGPGSAAAAAANRQLSRSSSHGSLADSIGAESSNRSDESSQPLSPRAPGSPVQGKSAAVRSDLRRDMPAAAALSRGSSNSSIHSISVAGAGGCSSTACAAAAGTLTASGAATAATAAAAAPSTQQQTAPPPQVAGSVGASGPARRRFIVGSVEGAASSAVPSSSRSTPPHVPSTHHRLEVGGMPADDRIGTLVTRGRFRVDGAQQPQACKPRRFSLDTSDSRSKGAAAAQAASHGPSAAAIATAPPASALSPPPPLTAFAAGGAFATPATTTPAANAVVPLLAVGTTQIEHICSAAEACTLTLQAAAHAVSPSPPPPASLPRRASTGSVPAVPSSPLGLLLSMMEARREALREENELLHQHNRSMREWLTCGGCGRPTAATAPGASVVVSPPHGCAAPGVSPAVGSGATAAMDGASPAAARSGGGTPPWSGRSTPVYTWMPPTRPATPSQQHYVHAQQLPQPSTAPQQQQTSVQPQPQVQSQVQPLPPLQHIQTQPQQSQQSQPQQWQTTPQQQWPPPPQPQPMPQPQAFPYATPTGAPQL